MKRGLHFNSDNITYITIKCMNILTGIWSCAHVLLNLLNELWAGIGCDTCEFVCMPLPFWHVSPSNPVPEQSQVKVPGVLVQAPVLHGVPELHSSTSAIVMIIWAATWQNQQNECAPSEDSDQPGHPPSLIRVFTVRIKKALALGYPLSAQRRLWSDWADAQADLSLRWAHSHFVGFVMRRLI